MTLRRIAGFLAIAGGILFVIGLVLGTIVNSTWPDMQGSADFVLPGSCFSVVIGGQILLVGLFLLFRSRR